MDHWHNHAGASAERLGVQRADRAEIRAEVAPTDGMQRETANWHDHRCVDRVELVREQRRAVGHFLARRRAVRRQAAAHHVGDKAGCVVAVARRKTKLRQHAVQALAEFIARERYAAPVSAVTPRRFADKQHLTTAIRVPPENMRLSVDILPATVAYLRLDMCPAIDIE